MFQYAAFHDERRRSRFSGLRLGTGLEERHDHLEGVGPGGGPLRHLQAGLDAPLSRKGRRLVELGIRRRIRATDHGEQGPGRCSRQFSWR